MSEPRSEKERIAWEVMEEAVRGFFMEKHLPFDTMDEWTDEVVAIVREHGFAPAQFGSGDGSDV